MYNTPWLETMAFQLSSPAMSTIPLNVTSLCVQGNATSTATPYDLFRTLCYAQTSSRIVTWESAPSEANTDQPAHWRKRSWFNPHSAFSFGSRCYIVTEGSLCRKRHPPFPLKWEIAVVFLLSLLPDKPQGDQMLTWSFWLEYKQCRSPQITDLGLLSSFLTIKAYVVDTH